MDNITQQQQQQQQETPIDFTVSINYTDNTQYRKTLRSIFRMECQYILEGSHYVFKDGTTIHKDDIDEETLDELNIDQSRYDQCFTYIWNLTHEIPLMVELYSWSSAKYLSQDPEMGIAFLLNYHHLLLFYPLLQKIQKGELVSQYDIDIIKNTTTDYAEFEPFFD